MTTMTATDARRELFNLIKKTNKVHQHYRIHHRDGSAVLMSEEDYESLIETLHLHSVPGFKSSIRKSVKQMKDGETLSFDEVFAR